MPVTPWSWSIGARIRFAELGMRPDQRPLLLGQRPGLEQDRVRDPDLADVVEERAELQPLQRVGVEAELAADAEEVSVIQRVRGGVLVPRLERVRERLDGGEEGAPRLA